MKKLIVRLILIIVALMVMLIYFTAWASADSSPNRCGLLPCMEPTPQCKPGPGAACDSPPSQAPRSPRYVPTATPWLLEKRDVPGYGRYWGAYATPQPQQTAR